MLPTPDALSAFYLFCFLLGLVFVLLSALMGLGHDLGGHLHLPGLPHGFHVGDAGHGGHAGGAHVGGDAGHVGNGHAGAHAAGDAHAGESRGSQVASASPLNLMTIMAFLTWFGGAGYILHAVYGVFVPLGLLGAVAAGLVAGWLVFLFLVRVLLPGTAPADERDYEVVGNVARVTMAIEAGRVGEVVYTLGGARHSDGARSLDGLPIPRGTEVVIVRYEKGIAYVEPWNRFLEDEGASGSHAAQP